MATKKAPDVTTMFVTNLPDGSRKETVKKLFSRHGIISDVYMATKKDSNIFFFAFFRFKEVKDEMQLEMTLQGLNFMGAILEINVAKFERKAASTRSRMDQSLETNMRKLHQNAMGSFRDGISFAAVLSGREGPPALPPPPELTRKPIFLEVDSFWAH
ncbi:unnamed protein product [Lactuca saligna]|uniref:RRM domain-containing protein n=1 Tax=Lactuca saligna TaxID=75948 RepID=A0AA36A1X6_LACSI|nr:unnamed protein product [Lactuca saligna]